SGDDRHRGESAGAAAGNSAAGDRTVPAKKNRARSEKQPTKRQLRKNRERARKRDRRRRIEAETEK
ncbi:MAG: hypothetical protein Q4F96_03045, partial [Bacillota bacterium]|nr:hypothetical protein [Bacillota bacterium]